MIPAWLEEREQAVRIRLYIQPRASRTEITGSHGDALRIRIAAPPVDGAANDELVRFLAKTLRVPGSAVRLIHGQSGRNKTVEISGIDAAAVRTALRLP